MEEVSAVTASILSDVYERIALADAITPETPNSTTPQVAQHTTHDSAWFVHEGKVYDATAFLEEHPGGADSILTATGADATEDFNAIHSKKVRGKSLLRFSLGAEFDCHRH